MSSLASINIKFTADLRGFSSEMQNSLRQIDKAGQQFQKIGRSMSAFVTLPILAAGAAAVKFASDYNESLNKVDVSFKSSSIQVKEFAKNSLESFGIAESTALDMAAAYGDMGTSMGLTTGQAAKMSTSLVGLAGDLASFKNISIDIANTAISSIFTGETESLKKLGIVMTEVNLKHFALNSGITKTYETMSQAEKVQLRYNYILSVTKNAQGDFERTQGGAANQTRIFTESLKQVGQQLGAVILPLFTKVITAINEKIKAFGKLSEGTKTVIVVVAGLVAVIGQLLLGIGAILSAIPLIVAGFAVVSGAIIPILAGLALVTAAFFIFKTATAGAAVSHNALNEAVKKGEENAIGEVSALDKLYASATNVKLSIDDRKKSVDQLQALYPAYFSNLDAESIKNGVATKSYNELKAAIFNKSRAVAIDGELQKNANDRVSKELDIRNKIAVTEKEISRLKTSGGDVVIKGNRGEKELDITLKKSDLINAQTRLLKIQNAELIKFNADALSADEVLYKAKEEYSKKSIKLIQNEAAVAKAQGIITPNVAAPAKVKKAKAEKRDVLEPILGTTALSTGNIDSYDAEIAKLKEFISQVSTTADQVVLAEQAIKDVEFAKALNFDPSSVIKSVETTEQMMKRLAASVSGAKAVVASEMIDITAVISEAVTALANNAAVGFGEAIGSLIAGTSNMGNVISGMIGMIANFMGDLGKQLVALGIAKIAFDKLKISGAGAVVAGIALIALSTVFKSTLNNGPKTQAFANGGIVAGSSFYGDKIMARVNSAEMISNTDQQKRIWGAMNSGGDSGGFIASTKLVGPDLLIWLERAQARKNRLG